MIIFINTINNITTINHNNETIYFEGRLRDEYFHYAIKNKFAEPDGETVKFSKSGGTKFLNYIKELMKKNGSLRNKKGNRFVSC